MEQPTCECTENPKESVYHRAKYSSSECLEDESTPGKDIKVSKNVFLFKQLSLINPKVMKKKNETLSEKKTMGDEIAFKNSKDDHMGQKHQATSPLNTAKISRTCTIL